MTIRTLVVLSAAVEMATGIALMAAPGFISQALLGQNLSGTGIAVARLAGLGLFSLGLACWPGQADVTPREVRGLLVYNLLAALYLGYLRVGAGFVSYLLWPACGFHVLMTMLIAIQSRRRSGLLG